MNADEKRREQERMEEDVTYEPSDSAFWEGGSAEETRLKEKSAVAAAPM